MGGRIEMNEIQRDREERTAVMEGISFLLGIIGLSSVAITYWQWTVLALMAVWVVLVAAFGCLLLLWWWHHRREGNPAPPSGLSGVAHMT